MQRQSSSYLQPLGCGSGWAEKEEHEHSVNSVTHFSFTGSLLLQASSSGYESSCSRHRHMDLQGSPRRRKQSREEQWWWTFCSFVLSSHVYVGEKNTNTTKCKPMEFYQKRSPKIDQSLKRKNCIELEMGENRLSEKKIKKKKRKKKKAKNFKILSDFSWCAL